MGTRLEIADGLWAAQARVLAFFDGLTPEDLQRPVTASEVPDGAPWSAKDHLAHLIGSEHNRQRLVRAVLSGEPPQAQLRLQYPPGMPLPRVLGDWDALTPGEQEQLELAVAHRNQAYVEAHRGDTLDQLRETFLAARQDTSVLLHRFTDEELTRPVPTVVREQDLAAVFRWGVPHPADHLAWIQQGLRSVGGGSATSRELG